MIAKAVVKIDLFRISKVKIIYFTLFLMTVRDMPNKKIITFFQY